MKVSFWSVLGMIGTLASELGSAAEDGKITLTEGVKILSSICAQLGIDFDTEGLDVGEPT